MANRKSESQGDTWHIFRVFEKVFYGSQCLIGCKYFVNALFTLFVFSFQPPPTFMVPPTMVMVPPMMFMDPLTFLKTQPSNM